MKKVDPKLKKLLALSLTDGKLDANKILTLAKRLSKRELRLYYKILVNKRLEEKVVITTTISLSKEESEAFQSMFPGKDLEFCEDKSIIAGMTVGFSDLLFDASFKAYLSRIKKHYENN